MSGWWRCCRLGWLRCHPFVVVEVACGTPPGRSDIIDRLGQLESVPVASPDELLALRQRRALFGRGCGFVDISLLASALLSDYTVLWTMDKRLAAVATALGRAYRPALAA